jgi:hypothetical protein
LIIIIALGGSIVALGVGAGGLELDAGTLVSCGLVTYEYVSYAEPRDRIRHSGA